MHKQFYPKTLLVIIFFAAASASSRSTINIGLLNNDGEPNLQGLIKAIVESINQHSNSTEPALRLALSNVSSTNLHHYGNFWTNQNVSLVLDLFGSWQLTMFTSSIMTLPSFIFMNNVIDPMKEMQNSFSMLPNPMYNIEVTKKILNKFNWKIIGIVYEVKRTFDLNLFMKSSNGQFVVDVVIPITCNENGTIEEFSYKEFNKFASVKLQAIVIIFNQDNLQTLFTAVASNKTNLQGYRINLLILDFIQNTSLAADNMYTLIGAKVDIQDNIHAMNMKSAKGQISSPSEEITMDQALLYDAITVGEFVLKKLKKENKLTSDGLGSRSAKLSYAANFRKEIEKLHLTGLTGNIQFNTVGFRRNMSLQIMNLRKNHFQQVGMVDVNGNLSLNQSSVEPNANDFNHFHINKHLRIVTIQEPPFIMKTKTKNGSYVFTGFLIDLLNEIAREAKFNYTLYEVADNDYGQLINGTWTGLVGDVYYNKADFALAPLTVSAIRQQYVQFAKPFIEVPVSTLRLKEKERSLDLLQFMEPFTLHVWMIIGISCIITGFVLYLVDYFSPFGWRQTGENSEGKEFNLKNSIWFSLASFLLQGADNTPRSLSGRILVGFFWFSVLILTSTYTANLAAFFTSTKSMDEASDIESLLKRGYSFTMIKNYSLAHTFASADYKVYRQLYERISFQNTFAKSSSDGMNRVRNDPTMLYIEERPAIEWLVNKKPCEFTLIDGVMSPKSYGMPLRQFSPYTEALSIGISKAQESGFIEKKREYYWKTLSECRQKPLSIGITKDGRIEPLQMFGVYSLLIAGIVISTVAMFGERWWERKVKVRANEMKERFKRSLGRAAVAKRLTKVKVMTVKPDATWNPRLSEMMKEEFAKNLQEVQES